MSKFKIGDRVVGNMKAFPHRRGVLGTVVGHEETGTELRVVWDNEPSGYHVFVEVYEVDLYDNGECAEPVDRPKPLVSNVEKPSHYNQAGIEAIDAIRAALGPEGFQSYCNGNTFKYLWRYKYKNGLEDLKKAQVYLNWMIESLEEGNKDGV